MIQRIIGIEPIKAYIKAGLNIIPDAVVRHEEMLCSGDGWVLESKSEVSLSSVEVSASEFLKTI